MGRSNEIPFCLLSRRESNGCLSLFFCAFIVVLLPHAGVRGDLLPNRLVGDAQHAIDHLIFEKIYYYFVWEITVCVLHYLYDPVDCANVLLDDAGVQTAALDRHHLKR